MANEARPIWRYAACAPTRITEWRWASRAASGSRSGGAYTVLPLEIVTVASVALAVIAQIVLVGRERENHAVDPAAKAAAESLRQATSE